jgi:hypothetical protein
MLAALARRGLHRWENRSPGAPAAAWIALHVGDHGKSDCRLGDAEAANVVNASEGRPSHARAA